MSSRNSEDTRTLNKQTQRTVERLRRQMAKQRVAFVFTEIDTGISFCKVALSTRDPERRTRSIDNALTGLRSALHFVQGAQHDFDKDSAFQEAVANLKRLLCELGQEV